MSDLDIIDMHTVEIPAGDEATFYLYVDTWPAKIKFTYSVQNDQHSSDKGNDPTPIDVKVRPDLLISLVLRGQRHAGERDSPDDRSLLRIQHSLSGSISALWAHIR